MNIHVIALAHMGLDSIDQVAKLTEERDALLKQLEELRRHFRSVQTHNVLKDAQILILEQHLDRHHKHDAEISKKISEIEQSFEEAHKLARRAQRDLETEARHHRADLNEMTKLRDERDQLKNKAASIATEHEQDKNLLHQQYVTEMAGLKAQISELQKEVEKLSNELIDQSNLEPIDPKDIEEVDADKKCSCNELETLRKRIAELESQAKTSDELLTSTGEENDRLKASNSSLTEQIEMLSARLALFQKPKHQKPPPPTSTDKDDLVVVGPGDFVQPIKPLSPLQQQVLNMLSGGPKPITDIRIATGVDYNKAYKAVGHLAARNLIRRNGAGNIYHRVTLEEANNTEK